MTSLTVLVVEIWVFTLAGLLLHRANLRFGLAPLLFYVAALMAILNFAEILALYIDLAPGITLRTGGHVFVPVILMIVLVLYVSDGTRPAQLVIFSLVGVNLIVVVVLGFLLAYQNIYDPDTVLRGLLTQRDLITVDFLRGVIASLIAFAIDMFVIAIVYQGLHNAFPRIPVWMAVGLALLAALWTDSIVYNVLYFVGTRSFVALLPGDVLAKTLAALVVWPPVAYYLVRIAPGTSVYVGIQGRPTLDLLFGAFGRVNHTLEQMQAQFRESQVTYRQLADNITEVFWLAGADGTPFYYLNPAFETLTGRKRELFYRKPGAFLQIIHAEDRERIAADFPQYVRTASEDEFRIYRPDGEVRWVRSRIFALYNARGDVDRVVGLAEDVTERRQSEARERALTFEQEKVRLLRDFVRDASHDLRTPLATIKLKVALLRRVTEPEKFARHLDELDAHVDFLTNLIDDLFTLSRLEESTLTFSPQDIHQIVRQIYETMLPVATSQNLTLRLSLCTPEPLFVIGDSTELARAVTNLVVNAIRYCREGEVELRTRLGDDRRLIIEVEDSGIGISPADLPHVFERFYRGNNAQQAGIEGTGLGLAIVKTIVSKHSGTLAVDSTLGQGSRFSIYLPLAEPGVDSHSLRAH